MPSPTQGAAGSRAAVSEMYGRNMRIRQSATSSEHRIVYLYVDGIAERLRPGQPREAVIAAWRHQREQGASQHTSPEKSLVGIIGPLTPREPGRGSATPRCRAALRSCERA